MDIDCPSVADNPAPTASLIRPDNHPVCSCRELLDEALDVSLAIRITRHVTLCLAAFAHLALTEGDPERAALLARAAEGLRRRVGLHTWPILRQGEAELAAQARQALGNDRFGQAFATGFRISQQEAVAATRNRHGDRSQPP